jgi:hypothetical protein
MHLGNLKKVSLWRSQERAKFCDRTDKNVNFENEIKLDLKIMFEQTFKNIDDILYKDSGATVNLIISGRLLGLCFFATLTNYCRTIVTDSIIAL